MATGGDGQEGPSRKRGPYLSWLNPADSSSDEDSENVPRKMPRSTAWSRQQSLQTANKERNVQHQAEDAQFSPEDAQFSPEEELGSSDENIIAGGRDAELDTIQSDTSDDVISESYADVSSESESDLVDQFLSDNSEDENKFPHEYSGFKSLKDLAQTVLFRTPITEIVTCSRGEIMLMLLQLSTHHSFSNQALIDVVKVINSIFIQPVLPETQHKLDKILYGEKFSYHFYCSDCSQVLGEKNEPMQKDIKCPNCAKTNETSNLCKATYYITVDISEQLQLIFKEHGNVLVKPSDAAVSTHDDGLIKDIYDGEMYQSFASCLPPDEDSRYVSLTFCTDGTPLYKSSNSSLWPITVMINELPPDVRTKNIILAGMWSGPSKPQMDAFLEPFCIYMSEVGNAGVKVTLKDETVAVVKMRLIACCADSVARGPIQGISQHNGEYSCNWCLHPGERQSDGSRKFPLLETGPPPPRTHDSIKSHAQELVNDKEKGVKVNGRPITHVCGVRSVSPLLLVNSFDLVNGMVVDVMHLAWLGVSRQIAKAWFDNDGEDYYVGSPTDVAVINQKLLKLTCPIETRRLPRSVNDRKFWKAKEWENWSLFYSIPVLSSVLPDKYVKNWALFVEAMHLLLSSRVTERDLAQANELLNKFVEGIQAMYGVNHMTYNMHILLHLPENVKRWGPLYAISAYAFESVNGDLKKMVHANRGVQTQICRRLSHDTAKKILSDSLVLSKKTKEFISSLTSANRTKQSVAIGSFRVFGTCNLFIPTDEESWLFSEHCPFDPSKYVTFKKAFVNGFVLSTSACERTNNTVVQLNDGSFARIRKIVVNETDSHAFIFASIVRTESFLNLGLFRGFEERIRRVTFVSDELLYVDVPSVKIIAFFSACENVVVSMPNVHNTL